ncbi:MAG: DUF4445 domain-containing protein, partial [Deltaproteobacteria bacterium]|nr:DUF4445 domain-containing protein [Deltaproteobacteria bacterium]
VGIRYGEAIDFRPPEKNPLGLAIDLGTTSIAVYLVDMETGRTLASEGMMNPQRAYGDDVMSRISYAMSNGGGRLRQVVIEGLNDLIGKLCPEPECIMDVTLAGNTVMHHLFLGLPVKQLGLAPYLPVLKTSLDVKARDVGLHIAPGSYVYMLPNVAGFIGSDHIAMILATRIHETDKTVIALDIGTNTEIVLVHRGKTKSVSCASGPAFEGGHIKYGIGAISGAIERVTIRNSDVEFQTVDGDDPIGICGSGVLDTVAELCRLGFISRKGQLQSAPGVRQCGSMAEFLLVSAEKSGTQKDITITQKDIHEVQLAKAAIRTGIDMLLDEMEIGWKEVEEVIITGGFGASINPESALAINMFPPLRREQFNVVKNAAGMGSKLTLISKSERAQAEKIGRKISNLELMAHPHFNKRFAQSMYFSTHIT